MAYSGDRTSDLDSHNFLDWKIKKTKKSIIVLELLGVAADDYRTHNLRKTKTSSIYDATKNVEAVWQLLVHASIAATNA